jgi:hypothetical protein
MQPFFATQEIADKGFWGEDRKGVKTFFPLTSMAIGAVVVRSGSLDNHEDVASAAAAAKRKAKKSTPQFHIEAAEQAIAPTCA